MASKTLALAPRVPPLVLTVGGGTGLSTRCPSPTLSWSLGLGPTNPEWMDLPQEPLDFRCVRFSRTIRYSCRHSHFHPLQRSSRCAFAADGTLPYRSASPRDHPEGVPVGRHKPIASVTCLAPFHCRRHTTRPVSCYALFQGWLLLSQPPGCLSDPTAFPTPARTRGP